MHFTKKALSQLIIVVFLIFSATLSFSQFTPIGNGSYRTNFPGTDAAGRNSFPSGTPQLSGNALGKPVPTNDWWSYLVKSDHANNLFNYPMAMKTTPSGLVVSYIPWGVFDDQEPIIVGLSGLNSNKATVSDFTDWTVTMDWNDGSNHLQATSGIGMPFLYFTKESADLLAITVNLGTASIDGEMLIIENARNGADFVFYAPSGSTWTQNGQVFSSTLNGENYWSMAMIPLNATNISTVANEYKKYAYVFPVNTSTTWTYNESNSTLRTDFLVETETKEGTETNVLLGMLPHQWANLTTGSPQPDKYTYSSIRGELKTMDGNSFSVENTFKGILPTLPYLANYSDGFSPADMDEKISAIENDGLATWTDSYNEGQVMNRLIQTARIADQTGNYEARDKMIATVKERLENWLTAESGEVAFLFYYNSDWSTMIGYPAGHGQDGNINDHHFHWGYFIHAAAFMEQFEPGWANEWGDMVNLLVRDAASSDRQDDQFPFLRNFSPYAGHCWANGFATFPQGNDQESTSESMQFNSSLIHWGTVTGNDEIRDLGIYLYTTEQTAIEEYWFDMYERNFQQSQQYSLVSRVWGNSYDNGTFWTSDIAASYGIELYPIHGGSLYLSHNTDYVEKLWNEISSNTGILSNEANPNLWHDIMWQYLSMIDPASAIELYNSNPNRDLKFGVSDAQTYHWIHSMAALGIVRSDITADYPIASAFDKGGSVTYVAHNYSSTEITVNFSDGFQLLVPAGEIATSVDISATGILSSDFTQAYPNGSVNLTAEVTGTGITKVELYDGNNLVNSKTSAPYQFKATDLSLGIHGFYAKIYEGENFNLSNIVSVQVGEQIPYLGTAFSIPGVIDGGHYDKFEGGSGQGISYVDVSNGNNGDFRTDEDVDSEANSQEGATVGWISSGEWLEYSIEVETAGNYNLEFRYASGNQAGGGPMHLEIDGLAISSDASLSYTGGWNTWATKTVNNIELNQGEHILRVVFTNGEFNLGRMTFTYDSPLGYSPPVANAGDNVVVILPESTAVLDGSQSSDPENQALTYLWEQIYGPTLISFDTELVESPNISNLEEGVYKCKLTINDGEYSSSSYVLVIVSSSANVNPTVSITNPGNNASYYEGKEITITASANDLDGTVSMVEFYDGETKIGEDMTDPFSITWSDGSIGSHSLKAVATDNLEGTGESATVNIDIVEAPSCSGGPSNGDYTFEFSDDKNNPTLTFIPGSSGVGSPTCILYYGTTAPYPGYGVTPNTPFQINAAEGSTINFYYTYSYNGMERNTSANQHSYIIGSCVSDNTTTLTISNASVSINENSETGTSVITPAVNYTGTASLSYSLLSGNTDNAYNINGSSGEITVAGTLDYETLTSYSLEVQVTDGTLTETAIITVAINDVDELVLSNQELEGREISLFPNPVSNILIVEWKEFKKASIYNISGNLFFESFESSFSVNDLPKGIYLIKLEGKGDQLYYRKINKN